MTVAKEDGSPISIHWIANDGDIDPNADINATILADMKKSADDGKQYRMAVLRLIYVCKNLSHIPILYHEYPYLRITSICVSFTNIPTFS